MTVFPSNNLPTDSLNWSREVEKAVNNLEASFNSAEINNLARDTQLQNNYKRLDSTLVQLIATNAAVEQAQNDALGALTTAAAANDTAESANAAAITALEDASAAQADALAALQDIVQLGSPGGPTVSASNITVGTLNADLITAGTLSADRIGGGVIAGVGNITSGGTIYAVANLGAGGNIGVSGTGNFGGDITTSGGLTRSGLSGGGTTGASFTNSGSLVRTTSSARYKTDIHPLEIDLTDLYSVEPKTFKRIEEVEEDSETARIYPGFIAEELAGTSLDKFVFYSQDEQGNSRPEGIHYPELTAALLLAIKDLNARLSALEDRV